MEEAKPNSSQPQVSQQQTVPPVASVHGTETAKIDQSGQPHDWIDKVNAGSTLVIATFTILMFIGVILRVWTSRDTERAWIVVNPVETSPPVGFVPGSSRIEQSTVGANQRNVFACSVKNTGETPARLVSVAVLYRTVTRLTDIPGEPDYGRLESANNMLLVKSDSIGAAAYLEPEPILSGADSLAVHRAQKFLYAFGIVKYKDALQSPS